MNEDDLLEQLKQLKDKMAPLQEELYIVRLKKRAGELVFGESLVKDDDNVFLLASLNTHLLIQESNTTFALWWLRLNKDGRVGNKGKYLCFPPYEEIGKYKLGEANFYA